MDLDLRTGVESLGDMNYQGIVVDTSNQIIKNNDEKSILFNNDPTYLVKSHFSKNSSSNYCR